jgi:heme/copper-type cytochrome/quinol oxidase subunit 4
MAEADRKLVIAWAAMLALTLLSFESSVGAGWLADPRVAITVVIGVAMVKVRIVVLQFMEAAQAPWLLRAPLEIWIAALTAGIVGLWLFAGG